MQCALRTCAIGSLYRSLNWASKYGNGSKVKGLYYFIEYGDLLNGYRSGTWQQQRSILRQNVTSIKFVDDGEALLGGTRDGVL